MTPPPLACTVRGCGRPLVRQAHAWVCARAHSFDVARSGYVNLLQPQDRKAAEPGDARSAVDARAVLLTAGIGQALIDEVVRLVATLQLRPDAVVLDLGSGTGDALAAIVRATACVGIGIDLSAVAAEHAARRYPNLTWVVANADRRLPLLDATADVVLSLHGRRNPAECARVLRDEGRLILAVPAADDLIELRAAVQGSGVERDRVAAMIAEHAPAFLVLDRAVVREKRVLDPAALRALLAATYRGARRRAAAQIDALANLEVTLASDVAVLRRSPTPHAGVPGGLAP